MGHSRSTSCEVIGSVLSIFCVNISIYGNMLQKRKILHLLWWTISRYNVQHNYEKKNVILYSEHHHSVHGHIVFNRSYILPSFGQRRKGNKLFYSLVKFKQAKQKICQFRKLPLNPVINHSVTAINTVKFGVDFFLISVYYETLLNPSRFCFAHVFYFNEFKLTPLKGWSKNCINLNDLRFLK